MLHRLDTLWNIDKHRRLALMAWWPDLISWGSNGPTNRRAFPGDGTVADGSILLYIEGSDEGQGDELSHEFNLVLTDDPAASPDLGATEDVVRLLEGWHQHIVNLMDPGRHGYLLCWPEGQPPIRWWRPEDGRVPQAPL